MIVQRSESLRAEVLDAVGVVTLCQPPGNSLTLGVARELAAIIEGFSGDEVRAIVLTGQGRVFSVGVAPENLDEIRSAHAGRQVAAEGQEMLGRLERSSTPVIAAINGLCLGGGLELAMACHLRFCSDRARLGLPELSLGLIPGLGGTQRLPRIVGVSRALRLILTGDTIAAAEAREIGLVDQVVSRDELMTVVMRFARRLATRSREAVAAALETTVRGAALELAEGLAIEADAFGRLCAPAKR